MENIVLLEGESMRVVVITAMLACAAPAAISQPMDPGETVISLPRYSTAGATRTWILADSEWGYVARFEKALADKLDHCASALPEAAALLRSGASRFSQSTLPALAAAKACGIAIDGDGARISLKTWMAVTASTTPPTVFDRAKTIAFRRSQLTPDYSHTLWDYDRTVYRESVFTWGPLHATLGEGCTLVKFLGYLNQRPELQDAMDFSFGTETETIAKLRTTSCSFTAISAAISPTYSDPERKKAFADGFAMLASDSRVRAAYDEQLLGPNGPRPVQFKNYYDLYRKAQKTPTEVDFAFILEHALLTLIRPSTVRLQELGQAAATQTFRTNADFRRWVNAQYLERSDADGRWVSNAGTRSMMNGRMTAYFIDGVGEGALTEQERRDWIAHSRTRASDVGLSDKRNFEPCEIGGSTNASTCTKLFTR